MRWDETAFGREYDLDIFMIVAVSDFNMGAMENKGLNVFNDKYVLASPDTATDADFAGIEAVIAHEYFHNWTGNRITCRDWFQLCLKEGLTVFRDQEFSSDMRSRPVKRISDVRGLRAAQFIEDSGPLAHPVRPETYKEINNFYTSTVYEKGAEVVRMVQTLIGREKFRAGMDLYFARHDGEAATVEQFIQCFADASGRDMTQFMRWYSQAGTPEVTVAGRYDAARKTYTLEAKQSVPPTPGQPTKAPMVIPLSVRSGRQRWPRPAARVARQQHRARRTGAERAGHDGRIHRHRRKAGLVGQSRLLGADQAQQRSRCRRSYFPRRARQRCVQPLAGAADHLDAAVDRQRGRAAGRKNAAHG